MLSKYLVGYICKLFCFVFCVVFFSSQNRYKCFTCKSFISNDCIIDHIISIQEYWGLACDFFPVEIGKKHICKFCNKFRCNGANIIIFSPFDQICFWLWYEFYQDLFLYASKEFGFRDFLCILFKISKVRRHRMAIFLRKKTQPLWSNFNKVWEYIYFLMVIFTRKICVLTNVRLRWFFCHFCKKSCGSEGLNN